MDAAIADALAMISMVAAEASSISQPPSFRQLSTAPAAQPASQAASNSFQAALEAEGVGQWWSKLEETGYEDAEFIRDETPEGLATVLGCPQEDAGRICAVAAVF